MKKIVQTLTVIIVGIVISHYVEIFEVDFLFLKIRNLIYNQRITIKSDDGFKYHKGMDNPAYSPVTHIQTVLFQARYAFSEKFESNYYDDSILDNNIDTAKILKVSNNLMNHVDTLIIDDNDCYRLPFNFPYHSYGGMRAGWYSGMAQGHAIELMLCAYILTSDTIYLNNACKFANLLNVKIENGGVMEKVDGGVWFEEYAQKELYPRPYVLNGHIFAIDGLYWLNKFVSDPLYEQLLYEGLEAVECNINHFSVWNYWSRYDKNYYVANSQYHRVHINQLNQLLTIDDYPNIKAAKKNYITGLYIPVGIFYRLINAHNKMLLVVVFCNIIALQAAIFLYRKIIRDFKK